MILIQLKTKTQVYTIDAVNQKYKIDDSAWSPYTRLNKGNVGEKLIISVPDGEIVSSEVIEISFPRVQES